MLELEELLAVDRRPHIERTKTLLAGCRVQDEEHARCSLAEVEHRPLEQLGTEVDEILARLGVPTSTDQRPAELLVDALLGYGQQGRLRAKSRA